MWEQEEASWFNYLFYDNKIIDAIFGIIADFYVKSGNNLMNNIYMIKMATLFK